MARERVIKDFKNLEEAVKVEETVKTGYCDAIKESLMLWIAVEEDMIDSYTRLSKKLGPNAAQKVEDFASESKNTIGTLGDLVNSFETLDEQRTSRIRRIKELQSTTR